MILKVAVASAAVPLIFLLLLFPGACGHLQTREELRNFKNATASVVLSDDGRPIGKFFSQNRTNITYSQIPVHLRNALIAVEDVRFFEHKGIDTRSMLRVLVKSILLNDQSSGGGSTITQQLAKNMFGRKNFGPFTVPVNKGKEIILARRLERTFSKEDILTLYLNTVPFGENIYGIEAAAIRYFNKKTDELNIEESAVLVGMLKANTLYNPRLNPENALARRNVVLQQMARYSYLSAAEADSLRRLPLRQSNAADASDGFAGYFLVQVKEETERILEEIRESAGTEWNVEEDGLIIATTLDYDLQDYSLRSFRSHLSVMQNRLKAQYQTPSGKRLLNQIIENELKRPANAGRSGEQTEQPLFDWKGSTVATLSVADSIKNALLLLHAGMLAIDPSTGAVKAWVGGIDFRTQPYDQVTARRQLASVFKPVLFAAAFEDGMEPCQYLENDSVTLSGFDNWSPENYDHSYGGKYSLAGALKHSMNIPAFSLYMSIGFEKIDSVWRNLGFTFPLRNTPSLALGTAEASIRETAVAYSAFANGGYRVEPQMIVSIKTPGGDYLYRNEYKLAGKPVLAERTTLLMNAILQKAITEGTGVSMGNIYGVSLPLAGKTGTSQDYSDAWFVGYNQSVTIVARVGASSRAIHFTSGSDGSGSALALPLVAMTLQRVERNRTMSDRYSAPFPELPPDLLASLDCPDFRDLNFFDRLFDLLENDRPVSTGRDQGVRKKRESLLRRLFRR